MVVRLTANEEVALELHTKDGTTVPAHETTGYSAELLWNATAYDRMQAGLKTFAESPQCMSVFLYHQLFGHNPTTTAPHAPAARVAGAQHARAQPLTGVLSWLPCRRRLVCTCARSATSARDAVTLAVALVDDCRPVCASALCVAGGGITGGVAAAIHADPRAAGQGQDGDEHNACVAAAADDARQGAHCGAKQRGGRPPGREDRAHRPEGARVCLCCSAASCMHCVIVAAQVLLTCGSRECV